jgi:hypothetical protein
MYIFFQYKLYCQDNIFGFFQYFFQYKLYCQDNIFGFFQYFFQKLSRKKMTKNFEKNYMIILQFTWNNKKLSLCTEIEILSILLTMTIKKLELN